MHIKTKKALASGALAISLGALSFGVAGIGPSFAVAPTPPEDPQGGGTTSTTTSVSSVDWCGWYISGVEESLVLANETGITTYSGDEIPLTAENSGFSAHVGGASTHDDDPENCSWYGDGNKQAVEVTLTANRDSFEATLPEGLIDTEMDFSLTGDNPLNITVAEDTACEGFTAPDSSDVIQGTDLVSTPVTSNVYNLVGTNDVCDWTITYTTNIPAGMVPTYGGTLYSYVGPTITTTLEIIDSAP